MRNVQELSLGFKPSSAHVGMLKHLQARVGYVNGQHWKVLLFEDVGGRDPSLFLLVFHPLDAGSSLFLCGPPGASNTAGPAIASLLSSKGMPESPCSCFPKHPSPGCTELW